MRSWKEQKGSNTVNANPTGPRRLEGRDYVEVHFRNGYATRAPFMRGRFKGTKERKRNGQIVFSIALGKILGLKNYDGSRSDRRAAKIVEQFQNGAGSEIAQNRAVTSAMKPSVSVRVISHINASIGRPVPTWDPHGQHQDGYRHLITLTDRRRLLHIG